jgi:hypothetical protein
MFLSISKRIKKADPPEIDPILQSLNSQYSVPLYSHSLDALIPSDMLPYICAARTRSTENISRDHYSASPLTHWLLRSKDFGMKLQNKRHLTATLPCVTSLRMSKLRGHKENTAGVLFSACGLRALPGKGFICLNTIVINERARG